MSRIHRKHPVTRPNPLDDSTTLYFYSKKSCPPCQELWEFWQEWKKLGACARLKIEKFSIDEKTMSAKERPPNFPIKNIALPFVALRHLDGSWQSFKQWPSAEFATIPDYSEYLFYQIDACTLPAQK